MLSVINREIKKAYIIGLMKTYKNIQIEVSGQICV